MKFTCDAIRALSSKPPAVEERIKDEILKAFRVKLDEKPISFFLEPGQKLFKFSFLVYPRGKDGIPTSGVEYPY